MTTAPYLPRVLIVDDQARVRSLLRSALEGMAQVLQAEDGERALEILQGQARKGAVDLILLDYDLPGRSGLEILLTTRRIWPWIRVVIVTGFGSEELVIQAMRAGASDYLKKPVHLDMLRRTVAALTTSAARRPSSEDPGERGAQAQTEHPSIRQALEFMRAHFSEAITLAGVAREAGLSRFHFCRLFHNQTGLPFHEYLHELRVSRAKVLLADRYVRVTDVAYAVGFSDLSHFDRTFRRIVGRSPTEYRSSLQCA